MNLESYEMLFYGGIFLIAAAACFLVLYLVIYAVRGKGLKRKLDEEYGDPQHYHQGNERKKP